MVEQTLFAPTMIPPSRAKSFMAGWGTVAMVLGIVLTLNVLFPQQMEKAKRYVVTALVAPEPVTVDHTPQPRLKTIPPPPPTHAFVVPAPRPHTVTAPTVEPPTLMAKSKAPAMPSSAPFVPKQPVQTGTFSTGSSAAQTTNKTAVEVQTGGFGDPNGVAPSANSHGPANIAAKGSFDLPQGGGYGNGLGGKTPGVVASSGFGNGTAIGNGSGGNGRKEVASTGFDNHTVSEVKTATVAKIALTPAEITFKPQPVYTEEGRRLGIEGAVRVRVKLTADQKVEVLEVISGLGHGLDEQAVSVAKQIKFKPAQHDGQAADSVVVLSIVFQLAS